MCCKAVRGYGASVVFFALDNHLQGDYSSVKGTLSQKTHF